MKKAALISTGVALASLAGASGAAAAPPPVPVNPAIAQYVEVVPTSRGPAVPGGRGRGRLPGSVTRRLRGAGAEGQDLLDVASSARYGAPQKRLHANASVAADARRSARKPPGGLSSSTLGAAAEAVGAGHHVVLWLGLALLATTALGAGAAIRRARR